MEFFRHCPACGRRFHIKRESKKLLSLDREWSPTKASVPEGAMVSSASPPVFVLQEGRPVVIDVEEFQYTYRCHHCGHEWTEKHVEEHTESRTGITD